MKAWLACLGSCAVLSACASTARVTGNFSDYRSYRRARLSTTVEERLGRSDRYLREFPQGDYRSDVRAWFLPAERRYFKLSWDNLPRLRAYLDALPKGPHAEDVADRISALESRRVFAERRDQRMRDKAQGFEAELARAADERRDLIREFSTLTRLLGATRTFGRPTSELDTALSSRFYAEPSAGTCEAGLCSKSFTFPYAVPDAKGLITRSLVILLEIRSERGVLRQLSLSAPDLLTRLAEAVAVHPVPTDSPQARSEALGQALDVVADALDAPLPKTTCEVAAVSPTVLARRCESVRLEVVAGSEAGAVDRISIAAAPRTKQAQSR